ncbi:hypothetical protein BDV25DRAFT_105033 [Aspergillus avenaceus]|uniref:Uncharacterized protein n=1 Tax=Aspergillus avenaceus TaxID=36643 RepID=A0A5N6TXN5_ASPAV|nr:hypothetical protein BDV25DRAFT_105033 [Aspergillus avenaceus]
MSHVSISKSYAVLAGIEGYTRTKHKVHALHEKVDDTKNKIMQSRRSSEQAKDESRKLDKSGFGAVQGIGLRNGHTSEKPVEVSMRERRIEE